MNASTASRNNRILVIDDNKAICEYIRKILRSQEGNPALAEAGAAVLGEDSPAPPALSFHVEAAGQGEAGLRMIEAAAAAGQPYAMAFVDVRMPPGWDGVETIARIWHQHPDLQVVLCPAHTDYSWEEMVRVLGRSDSLLILKKPFDNLEVLQMANALTQKWSLRHELTCRLNDLDRLVAQRTLELQSANEQLTKEIAQQIKLENQLRQAQKMEAVGQLAAGIAHDFNNILTVMQGNASLLLAGKPPASPDCRPLQNICDASGRAAKLVGQLLMFCRQPVVELRPTHLRDTLPALADDEPRTTAPPDSPATPPAARETILVVDDEPDLRDLVTQVLESGGYKVVSAGSGAEALEQWAKHLGNIHLLLTDIVMPDGLTGRKLADRLRGEDPRLRVVFTSGYSAGQPGTELANVEERSFLPKPYRPASLLRIVRDCLDRPCAPPTTAQQAA
jgi:CheY-like chemotaxis protein